MVLVGVLLERLAWGFRQDSRSRASVREEKDGFVDCGVFFMGNGRIGGFERNGRGGSKEQALEFFFFFCCGLVIDLHS